MSLMDASFASMYPDEPEPARYYLPSGSFSSMEIHHIQLHVPSRQKIKYSSAAALAEAGERCFSLSIESFAYVCSLPGQRSTI